MSVLDSLRMDALAALHATANALHASLATKLAQAGHDVSPDDHVDKLVLTATAASAATNRPQGAGVAPNYADHALAAFSTAMTHTLLQFAQSHLPAKFQPLLGQIAPEVEQAVGNVTSGQIAPAASLAPVVVHAAEAALEFAVPAAAPLVAAASPLIDDAVAFFSGADSAQKPPVGTLVESVADGVEQAVLPGFEAAADKMLPGLGAVAGHAVEVAVSAAESALDAHPDKTPPANPNGV